MIVDFNFSLFNTLADLNGRVFETPSLSRKGRKIIQLTHKYSTNPVYDLQFTFQNREYQTVRAKIRHAKFDTPRSLDCDDAQERIPETSNATPTLGARGPRGSYLTQRSDFFGKHSNLNFRTSGSRMARGWESRVSKNRKMPRRESSKVFLSRHGVVEEKRGGRWKK